jgi:tRNA pseudouridine55 synthase
VNKATRLFELFGAFEKEYEADVWLGLTTTTDDLTGELLQTFDAGGIDDAQFEAAFSRYGGTFAQLPPAFSLAKKDGKEMYRYALAGESVEVEPRNVTVLDSAVRDFRGAVPPAEALAGPDSGAAEGRLAVDADKLPPLSCARVWLRCTGGLYVRSVARDTGSDLGVGAAMGRLVRTRVGPFALDDCLSLEQIAAHMEGGGAAAELIQPLASIAPLESTLNLDATQLGLVRSGRSIRRFRQHMPPAAEHSGDMVYGIAPGEDLAAVLTVVGTNPEGLVELRPVKVIG